MNPFPHRTDCSVHPNRAFRRRVITVTCSQRQLCDEGFSRPNADGGPHPPTPRAARIAEVCKAEASTRGPRVNRLPGVYFCGAEEARKEQRLVTNYVEAAAQLFEMRRRTWKPQSKKAVFVQWISHEKKQWRLSSFAL
jgi:hypothetical protein